MKIGVLYSSFDKFGNKEVENDLLGFATSSHAALEQAGYTPEMVNIDDHSFSEVKAKNFDMIFNVCERLQGDAQLEPHVASALELLNMHITGSPGETIEKCNNKARAKRILKRHSIPTAEYQVFEHEHDQLQEHLAFPVIVKPISMQNSIGIFSDSIAHNEAEMREKVKRVRESFSQPALVEEFLEGKEVEVNIIGNRNKLTILPVMEVFYPTPRQLFCYEAKWSKGSEMYGDYREAQGLSLDQHQQLLDIAKTCYRLFGLRDYGRVDFRFDAQGNPHVIEITANPGLTEECSIMRAGSVIGRSQGDILRAIFHTACARTKNTPMMSSVSPQQI